MKFFFVIILFSWCSLLKAQSFDPQTQPQGNQQPTNTQYQNHPSTPHNRPATNRTERHRSPNANGDRIYTRPSLPRKGKVKTLNTKQEIKK